MIGNIKNMANAFIIAVLFSSCLLRGEKDTVRVYINPQNYGWYFVELNQEPLAKDEQSINVRIDSIMQLKKITISNYEKFAFKVYDETGTDVSSRMKLPGYLSQSGGKTFFEFYNPTEQELTEITNWNPTDPNYMEIVNKSRTQLNALLETK